ncbi:MAG: hypothetical protein WB679_25125 [Terracidiphilus sp.]
MFPDMRVALRQFVFVLLAVLCAGLCCGAAAQITPAASERAPDPLPSASPAIVPSETTSPSLAAESSAVELLRSFNDSDVKFDIRDLMEILRDRRHEGWVLAAYPDPKTGHPLIGAGFTLDLPAREHPQPDPLNPHPFLEPSSADLWRASGLDPDRLQAILDQYNDRFSMWKKKRFRQKIRTLTPQITDDEATLLLRIAAIQAIYNARAYCRNFDQMSASQQMAMSQLVYQMGVNLARFDAFLSLLNDGKPAQVADASLESPAAGDLEYWRSVQHSLMQSQWAKLYRTRAIAVIAMLDPAYADSPATAEHFVSATLRPAVAHRRRGRSASLNQVASNSGNSKSTAHRKRARTRAKRRA